MNFSKLDGNRGSAVSRHSSAEVATAYWTTPISSLRNNDPVGYTTGPNGQSQLPGGALRFRWLCPWADDLMP
jgi:hypothetical protein